MDAHAYAQPQPETMGRQRGPSVGAAETAGCAAGVVVTGAGGALGGAPRVHAAARSARVTTSFMRR
ncbi:MAG: hypothetical protein U0326_30890 [Polyangiales bacterium]